MTSAAELRAAAAAHKAELGKALDGEIVDLSFFDDVFGLLTTALDLLEAAEEAQDNLCRDVETLAFERDAAIQRAESAEEHLRLTITSPEIHRLWNRNSRLVAERDTALAEVERLRDGSGIIAAFEKWCKEMGAPTAEEHHAALARVNQLTEALREISDGYCADDCSDCANKARAVLDSDTTEVVPLGDLDPILEDGDFNQ